MSIPLPDLTPRRTWDLHPVLAIAAAMVGVVVLLSAVLGLVWMATYMPAPVSQSVAAPACDPDTYVPCLPPTSPPAPTPPTATPSAPGVPPLAETGGEGIGLSWMVWAAVGVIVLAAGLVITWTHRRYPETRICWDCRMEGHDGCDRVGCDCAHSSHRETGR